MLHRILIILLLSLNAAFAQGGGGSILPQGVIVPGDCAKFGTSKFFITDAGVCNAGITGFAIPTVPVTISPAAAGVLTTVLRSDAQLALNVDAPFAFTGLGATNLLTGSVLSWGGTTSASPAIARSGNSLSIQLADASDNTSLTAASIVTSGGGLASNQLLRGTGLSLGSTNLVQWSSTTAFSGTKDLFIVRAAPATLQLGAANAASPVAQTLQSQGSRAGTDNNIGGANLTISPGTGTGIGTLSNLIFTSPTTVITPSSAQVQTTSLSVKNGGIVLGSATLNISPSTMGINKVTASASAPGAAGGKIELVCGTGAGTAKLIISAGTSATTVTIADNIGTGVSGC